MATTSKNRDLHNAKDAKKDEFYTQLTDIEKELKHNRSHFRGKVVYYNCDDSRISNFFHYFSFNFEKLGLKKLIATFYKNQDADPFSQHNSERAIYLEYNDDKNGNNIPAPDEYGKKFLIIGNVNAITYKEVFKLISNKANTRATLLLSSKPKDIYYTFENTNGYFSIPYSIILLKNKKP
ncbi:MAG: adenine-specific methyltransferase EcoRI family protein [Tannerella sp.]|jgi:hypothetical protein|nr:adenine-specific methyltransferase EcoRI family protein [Tannerella sp.]